jgi:hypothetical protein
MDQGNEVTNIGSGDDHHVHTGEGRPEECGCHDHHRHERYCLNTEGREHEWALSTITTEQIAKVGEWPPEKGVIMVFADGTERTLKPGEVVTLEPGHGFCRKVRWKRGLTRVDRITAEIELLKKVFPTLRHDGAWILLPEGELPSGWSRVTTDMVFQITDGFPGAPPYGLYVPSGLRYNGQVPKNYTEPAAVQPPFGGTWGMFSWAVNDPSEWHPATRPENGANLLRWARSFRQRFEEGA